MKDILENLSEDELLGQLPDSVRRGIETLEANEVEWDQIGTLLASAPANFVTLKGGSSWRADMWEAVKEEFHSFLCTSERKYDDLRNQGENLREKSSKWLISALSGLIGAKVGVAAGVVAPLVVWLLLVGSRIGKEALCSSILASNTTAI